jgi:hypothetical protein
MVGKQGRRSYSGQLEVILHYFSRYPRQESLERVSPSWNCPVSLMMGYDEYVYLRCLKYVIQPAMSVVSPIMRQVCKPLEVSDQVPGTSA